MEAKYRAKYKQIDRLCQHSWSLEGLRREMWGVCKTIIVVVVVVVVDGEGWVLFDNGR